MHCGRVRRHRWSCSMRRPTVCHPSSPAHPWSEGLARKRPQPCVKGLGSDGQSSHVHHARDCKHGVRGGKVLPATALAMLPGPCKRPHFKTPRAHVCNHAPENTQNRAARCCYATHSRLTSPQRPFSSAYVPYLPISLTIWHWKAEIREIETNDFFRRWPLSTKIDLFRELTAG